MVVVEERDDILALVILVMLAADTAGGRVAKASQRRVPEDRVRRSENRQSIVLAMGV